MILTPEQQTFAEHAEEAFVEACPGAGKTMTILARLACISKTLPLRRGVAVLSFTNSAIEEFKERSASNNLSHLLRHPGYIGTLDAFIRHFIFLPGGAPESPEKPNVVDSWDSLGIEVRLRGPDAFAGRGVSLDIFDSVTGLVDESIASWEQIDHIIAHREAYERAARGLRAGLHRKGYFSASDARAVALERVRSITWGPLLGRVLAARFVEIIIDEAQDCNPEDIEFLVWLRSHGVRVTAVCDLNQSIYGFRYGGRNHLEDFANTYSSGNRLTLSGNFRSSPAICSLSASLRSNHVADTPLGPSRETTHSIAIYPYRGRPSSEIGQRFISHAASVSLSLPELIVLSHRANTARSVAGVFVSTSVGNSKIEKLSCAISEFWAGGSRSARNHALSSIEKLLLDLTGQREDDEPVTRTISRLGLNARLLRRQAYELVMNLPKTCADSDAARSAWIEKARELIQNLELTLTPPQTIRRALATPRNINWARHLEQSDVGTNLRYSTIHKAKGREYPAVCVVIPPDRGSFQQTSELITAWTQREEHESKRVIYVGVTRAQHLVAIAVPDIFVDRCASILAAAGVPFDIRLPDDVPGEE